MTDSAEFTFTFYDTNDEVTAIEDLEKLGELVETDPVTSCCHGTAYAHTQLHVYDAAGTIEEDRSGEMMRRVGCRERSWRMPS